MAGRPEAKFTKWFTRILVEDGAIIVPIVGSNMQSGWPDRLVVHRDWQGLVELKARTGKLGPRQRDNIESLCKRKRGFAVVVRELADAHTGRVETYDGQMVGDFVDAQSLVAALNRAQIVATDWTVSAPRACESCGCHTVRDISDSRVECYNCGHVADV